MAEQLLWTTVMNSQIHLHGESQRKRWKVATDNENICSMCHDNGGVHIRCNADRCSNYFHLDCALHQSGGLSLVESGLLTCECENHYKDIIFCSCKTKYDPTKAMIFCDECCDWYHLTCEHLSNPPQNLDKYTCRTCKELLNNGKTVNKSIKEKNLEKEFRSTCNQNAVRTLGILNDLAVIVCPIIDSITSSSGENNVVDASELKNAVEYLSSPPYLSASAASSSSMEKTEDELFLQLFEIDHLVSGWLKKCQESLSNWNSWLSQCEGLMTRTMNDITSDIIANGFSVIEQLFEEYKKTELSKPRYIIGFDGFIVFGDCLKWILDFYQVSCPLSFCFPLSFFCSLSSRLLIIKIRSNNGLNI
jgi:hypothetical protein